MGGVPIYCSVGTAIGVLAVIGFFVYRRYTRKRMLRMQKQVENGEMAVKVVTDAVNMGIIGENHTTLVMPDNNGMYYADGTKVHDPNMVAIAVSTAAQPYQVVQNPYSSPYASTGYQYGYVTTAAAPYAIYTTAAATSTDSPALTPQLAAATTNPADAGRTNSYYYTYDPAAYTQAAASPAMHTQQSQRA
ncbi:hypothetical protein GQ42DRAFT_162393 [Ramicandelaber brevisporus]|nr:hypothetical protein GQ42DRAFT_162393 [Ramicandelaber brevisporus]